jgi:ABC-2 type transport system permease protein
MASPTLEIIKKELSCYYSQKASVMKNLAFLVIFGVFAIYQLAMVVNKYGPEPMYITAELNLILALTLFFPVQMAGNISVMAFPAERDQKTLEHLLSLPLSNAQIFLGKFVAAVIAGLGGLAIDIIVLYGFVFFSYHVGPGTLMADNTLNLMTFVVCPMLVVLLILTTVVVSSHVSARDTYIVNLVAVFALLGLNTAVGSLSIDTLAVNEGLAAILGMALVVMYILGMKTFNRESLIKNL